MCVGVDVVSASSAEIVCADVSVQIPERCGNNAETKATRGRQLFTAAIDWAPSLFIGAGMRG